MSKRLEGKTIGFVPTMGFLHEGHISLVRKSIQENDLTAVSIFINPTQFAASEDLSVYPRNREGDLRLLAEAGCDYVFMPLPDDIYPQNFQTYISVQDITKILEGEHRPTHFQGVTTVVAILLNLSSATNAYFGRKDAQQAAIISRMVTDLQIHTVIHVCPIIREKDGLALSSRNVYLSTSEKEQALTLYNSLEFASKLIEEGERNIGKLIEQMTQLYTTIPLYELQYIAFVDEESFKILDRIETNRPFYILIACKIGRIRLIDNFLLSVN